jgi:AcrR family transcriptional regulator
MPNAPQDARRKRIEDAAFELLQENGFRSTSMLQIAKRASASNQTLYAMYSNKQALFRDIIERNGQSVRGILAQHIDDDAAPLETLEKLGPVLLAYVAGDRAIVLNRAAVADADDTGSLGIAIEEVGRGIVFPLIAGLMQHIADTGQLHFDQGPQEAAQTYVNLLFGETQIRQARGAEAPLTEDKAAIKAARAFTLFCRLYAA